MATGGTPEQRFDRLASSFLGEPGVTEGTGFGASPGLKVGGKIFAMLVKEQLMVKLSADQIDHLVAAKVGERVQMGKSKPMREWVKAPVSHSRRWPSLARDAHAFVSAQNS